MVEVAVGVQLKLFPNPRKVPVPFGPVYQPTCEPVPEVPPLAVISTVVLGQIVPGALSEGAVDAWFTVTVAFAVAVQPAADVTVTV